MSDVKAKPQTMRDLILRCCELNTAPGHRHQLSARCCGSSALRVEVASASGLLVARCWKCGKPVGEFQIAADPLVS